MPVRWKIGGTLNASDLKASFEKLCGEILGADRLWGPFAPGVAIRVAIYLEEFLQWTQKTSEGQFVRDIFYRIDHPNINIYPVGSVSTTH